MVGVLAYLLKTSKEETTEGLKAERQKIQDRQFCQKERFSSSGPDFGQSRGAVDERLSHSAKIYPDFSTSTRQWT